MTNSPYIAILDHAPVLVATLGGIALAVFCVWYLRRGQIKAVAGQKESGIVRSTTQLARPLPLAVNDDGVPLVELINANREMVKHSNIVDATPALVSGIEGFLHQVPNLLLSAAATQTYVLRFAPEVARGLQSGTLHLMKAVEGGGRAMAVNQGGTIAGHGALVPVAGNPLLLATAAWQVLAFVTAQKFLVDINKQLARLGDAIADIKGWLEHERLSKLLGNIEYLRSIEQHLRDQDLVPGEFDAFIYQLEDIERETTQIGHAFGLQMDGTQRDATIAMTTGSVHDNSQKLQEHIDTFGKALRGHMMAVAVRLTVAQVRSALPLSREIVRSRLRELQAVCANQQSRSAGFWSSVEDRRRELKGRFFTRTKTERKLKRQVKKRSQVAKAEIDRLLERLASGWLASTP